jgi:hypothetical protein
VAAHSLCLFSVPSLRERAGRKWLHETGADPSTSSGRSRGSRPVSAFSGFSVRVLAGRSALSCPVRHRRGSGGRLRYDRIRSPGRNGIPPCSRTVSRCAAGGCPYNDRCLYAHGASAVVLQGWPGSARNSEPSCSAAGLFDGPLRALPMRATSAAHAGRCHTGRTSVLALSRCAGPSGWSCRVTSMCHPLSRAHAPAGRQDLRDDALGAEVPAGQPEVNPRYKTRLCRWWTESGGNACPHGA